MTRFFTAILLLTVTSTAHASIFSTPSVWDKARLEKLDRALRPNALTPYSGEPLLAEPLDPSTTHILFSQPQDALNWANQVKPRLMANLGAKRFEVLPLTDPRYAVLQSYVHQLWQGYVQLFPEYTQGLSEPPITLVDSEIVNAFVPKYLLEENKIAHTVVVLTALIDKAGGVDQKDLLSGVMGHEIAHSVFRHALASYQERVNKYFVAKSTALGYKAVRDPGLDATISTWASLATLTGDLTLSELQNLPSNGVNRPILQRIWTEIRKSDYDDSRACWTARDDFNLWDSYQRASSFASQIYVENADLPALLLSSAKLLSSTNSCLQKSKVPFLERTAQALGVPLATVETMPVFKEMETTFLAAPNPGEGFQQLVAPYRLQMIAIEKQVPLADMGYFTYEEHADDISLIVHRQLGWNPLSLNAFFKSFLSDEDRARCESYISRGEVPPTGSFSDPHRATCFRIAHLEQLNQDMGTRSTADFAKDYISKTLAP